MSALGKILLYLVLVLLLAAALSPPVYWLGHWAAGQGVFTALGGYPFHRFFSRTTQFVALVLLLPLLWWLGIRHLREFGLERNLHSGRDLAMGLLFAIVPVILLGAVYLALDVYRIKQDFVPSGLLRIVLTAGFVAILEEFLFRGVLLGLAAKTLGRIQALLGVSLLFAVVHFLKSPKQPDGVVDWNSGFHETAAIFGGLSPSASLFFGFLSLFVGGLILGWGALQTRSLWLPIGLHAGWILSQQGLQWLAKFRVKPPEAFLPWVGPNLVSGAVPTGLAPVLALLITGGAVWLYVRHASAHRFPRDS